MGQSGAGGGNGQFWGNLGRWLSLLRMLRKEPLTLTQIAERFDAPYSTMSRVIKHQLLPLDILEVREKRCFPKSSRGVYRQRIFGLTYKGKRLAECIRHFDLDQKINA